jgi:hypothetical protein
MAKPTIIQVVKSVIAAAIGVQSSENRKNDFEQGSLITYVVVGVIFTLIFIGMIVFIVSLVL